MNTINHALLERLKHNREALLDDQGRVRIDLACRSCGYNLRGAAADGGCPECGHAVDDALQDDRPEHSNPHWLSRVTLGANLFGIAALAAVALLFLFILFGILFSAPQLRPIKTIFIYINLALIVATIMLALTGTWLITLRDPTRHHIKRETNCRWIARIGLTAFAPIGYLFVYLVSRTGLLYGNNNLRAALSFTGIALTILLLSAGLIALMLYLQTLATRAADWNLVQSITTVCYGLAGCAVFFLISLVLAIPYGQPAVMCGCCTALFAAALGLWMFLLIECTRQNLNAAKQRAKWNREKV